MKTGILTWSRNINYGGVLQAIALRTYLENIDVAAELIHYEPLQANLSYSRLLGLTRHARINGLLGFCLDVFLHVVLNGCFLSSALRLYRSRRFIKRFVRLSTAHYYSYEEICRQSEYSTIVVGSDQVWNPIFFMGKPAYLLADMRPGVKLISYAASVSSEKVSNDLLFFEKALPRYSAISLREKNVIEELQPFALSKIDWVVDPTLLLSGKEWESLLELPNTRDGRHLCVYWLSDIDEVLPTLFTFALKNKIKIHLFSNIDSFRLHSISKRSILTHLKLRYDLAISKWISYRKSYDAQMFLSDLKTSYGVISDSYHALMFSTIFSKKVRIIIPPERKHMGSRIMDFLTKSGVDKDLIISKDIGMPTSRINSRLLEDWKLYSQHWLQQHI